MAKALMMAGKQDGDATTAMTIGYYKPAGYIFSQSAETNNEILARSAGVISKLYCRVIANSSAGNTLVRSRKNHTNGNMSATVTSNTPGVYEDTGNTDTIGAGDYFSFQWDPLVAAGTITIAGISYIFDSTGDIVTYHVTGNSITSLSAASTTYFHTPQGRGQSTQTTALEANTKFRIRKAGTYKNLAVFLSSNARTTNTVWRSRKNGGNGNLTVTYGNQETGWKEDTGNTDVVAIGDDYNMSITNGTGIQTYNYKTCKLEFTNANGDALALCSGTPLAQNDALTRNYLMCGDITPTATEANSQVRIRYGTTASEMILLLTANDIAAAPTCKFRKNTANGNMTITITANTPGLYNDTGNTDVLGENDIINYQYITPSVSGTHNNTVSWISCAFNVSVGPATYPVALAESLNITEALARKLTGKRALAESLDISESILAKKKVARALAESLNITEAVVRKLTAKRATPESLNITEAITRKLTAKRAVAEALNLIEAIQSKKTAKVSLAEALTIDEILSRRLTAKRGLAETLDTTEVLQAKKTAKVALSESLDIIEIVAAIKKGRISLAEGLDLIETIQSKKTARVALSETLDLTEEVSGNLLTRLIQVALSESLDIIESLATRKTAKRSLIETLDINEQVSTRLTAKRALSESFDLLESLNAGKKAVRALAETLNLTDDLTTQRRAIVALAETLDLTDQITSIKKTIVALAESLNLTDDIRAGKLSLVNLVESLDISEDVSKKLSAKRGLSESLNIVEAIQRKLTAKRAVSESLTIQDELFAGKKSIVELSETLNLTDELGRKLKAKVALSESLDILEALQRKLQAKRNLAEALNITEDVAALKNVVSQTYYVQLEEALDISEQIAAAKKVIINLAETLNLAEGVTKKKTAKRSLFESLNIVESVKRRTKIFVQLAELLNITEDVGARMRPPIPIVPPSEGVSGVSKIKIRKLARMIQRKPKQLIEILKPEPEVPEKFAKRKLIVRLFELLQFYETVEVVAIRRPEPIVPEDQRLEGLENMAISENVTVRVFRHGRLKKLQVIKQVLEQLDQIDRIDNIAIAQNQTPRKKENAQSRANEDKLAHELELKTNKIVTDATKNNLSEGEIMDKYADDIYGLIRKYVQISYQLGAEFVGRATKEKNIYLTTTDLEEIKRQTDRVNAKFWRNVLAKINAVRTNEAADKMPLPLAQSIPRQRELKNNTIANMIATTATSTLLTLATLSKLQQLPAQTVGLGTMMNVSDTGTLEAERRVVTFVTMEDDRVCDICEQYNGVQWLEEDPFIIRPELDTHDNCRCELIPEEVTIEELDLIE